MQDYEPLDISKSCNSGPEILGSGAGDVETGLRSFRGLPFMIGGLAGGIGGNSFIAPSPNGGSVFVPVGKAAKRVLFAHALLETKLAEGGRLGEPVAEYVFYLSSGRQERVNIRERFEIAASPSFPPGTPGPPYRAVTDGKATLMPRYEGEFDAAGKRQTEATQATAELCWLWSWENPEPDSSIETIEIVPAGMRFFIAAITLGHLDEHPFPREGRRPAKITLLDEADAAKPFDIDVEVDRGDATYVFPLPAVSSDEFLAAPYSWGQDDNESSSPSYVEISATPSATVTVKQGDAEIGKATWGDVVNDGAAETEKVKIELIDPGKNWVHVTVVDDETGSPVPCRVHFRSPDGVPYQPHGHHNQVNSNLGTFHNDVGGDLRLGQTAFAYIDGTCQGWLPRGEVVVDVSRGFEYEPLRTKVSIEPGQRELELCLKRWTNMNAQGWYSGDSHVHFLSPTGAHLEAQGEDLDVVNLLQSQWGSLFTNTEDFTGSASVSERGDSIVYVGQENRQHFMGHMILWGLKRPIMPWCSDGLSEAEIGGSMETTLSYWADEAHAQGGFVVNPHFPNPNGEPAALVATGRLDGVEMIRQTEFNHIEYYRYLNGGYRLPLVGGTDKMSSDVPVGLYRTYAKLPDDEEFGYNAWCKSVASGRTFLSGGPIIHFSVDGKAIGDTVAISGPGTVEVEAWAESIFPINVLQIVRDGKVVAQAESTGGARRLALREKITVDKHTWLAARCGGPEYMGSFYHIDAMARGMFAHTSPIYVAVAGDWWMFSEETARYMLTLIEGSISYIRETSAQHTHGGVTHHHGQDDHIAYLEAPFHEAHAAVHERAERLGVRL